MPQSPAPMRRVIVGGISGAGKSTMARWISRLLALPYYEVDALCHGPGWTQRPTFVADVQVATAGDSWVVDSDEYPEIRDLVWSRADTLVWLDMPRSVVVQAVSPLAGLVGGLVLLVLGLFLILGVRPPMNRSQSGVHVEREPLPTG